MISCRMVTGLLALALPFMVPSQAVRGDELWLAIGYGGRRMISTDGLRWEITAEWAQPGGDDGQNLMSALFAQGKFVVVGGGGGGAAAAGHVLVSSDGRTWRETLATRARINPVVYGGGRFVVGESGFPSGGLWWSLDAETWQPGPRIAARGLTHFRHGAYGNGRFVLVGNGQQKQPDGTTRPIHWAVVTLDGQSLASEHVDLPGHGRLVFGAGRFVMLSAPNNAEVLTSTNGAAWERAEIGDGAAFSWLVWTGSEFLVGGPKQVYRSDDGVAWERTPLNPPANVLWSDGRRFITSSWPGKMGYSPDGQVWHSSPPLSANGINRGVIGETP